MCFKMELRAGFRLCYVTFRMVGIEPCVFERVGRTDCGSALTAAGAGVSGS